MLEVLALLLMPCARSLGVERGFKAQDATVEGSCSDTRSKLVARKSHEDDG